MVILIATNRDTGKPTEVGLFDTMDAARWHVSKNGNFHTLWSVWTPEVNSTIRAASITGLSMPPDVRS